MKLAALLVLAVLSAVSATPSNAEEVGLLARLFANPPAAEQTVAKPAAQSARAAVPAAATLSENTGVLRSGDAVVRRGFFGKVLGYEDRLLPETQALDASLRGRKSQPLKIRSEFEPQSVSFSGYQAGTVVIDTASRFLYLVESRSSARRYAIAVGREGLEFKGTAVVGDKQEWPRWFPTKAMQQREPAKYGRYKDGMNGGADNPLGARAIYLYQNKRDTHVRIHGTNQPQTIGTNSSNGCFRMINEHVIDLYSRVPKGATVVVL